MHLERYFKEKQISDPFGKRSEFMNVGIFSNILTVSCNEGNVVNVRQIAPWKVIIIKAQFFFRKATEKLTDYNDLKFDWNIQKRKGGEG